MNSDEATTAVIDTFDTLGIPYMVVGSLVGNFYGIPRATEDVDFVVQLEAGKLPAIMQQLGPRFRLDPQTTFETATSTCRYVLELTDKSFLVKLFLLSDDAHDQERFARRRRVRILNRETFILTPEDAIITKLRWFDVGRRPKDLQDARGMSAVQGDRVDWDYVTSWCDRHDTRKLLDQVRE
ncbi:MAG: hypothetical protein KKE86_03535 [Planctomycetes bacterium]|nr:hypothetical protein [Planctomycetota bacterium]MBU4398389.1 hypothetical protein [Planctomycetota bacterium]MCG2683803.1 hypothetical protein [Planctomycetales bacterium]